MRTPTLNIVLKTDVRGSLEALITAINDISTDEVRANIVSSGVGGINESDANLALASKAVVIGFNVRADSASKRIIRQESLDLRYYGVIYELLDDIKQVMSGMLAPELREKSSASPRCARCSGRRSSVPLPAAWSSRARCIGTSASGCCVTTS